MNEISSQPMLNAKASSPNKPAERSNESGSKDKPSQISQEEVGQTEKQKSVSIYAQGQKEGATDANEDVDKEAKSKLVESAVAQLNDYVQSTQRTLEFQLDEDSGETVIKVYDKVSEELIRQMPNEEALELAQKLNQEEPLMLFSAQV